MNPNKVSARIRHIAAYIDSNTNPDRKLVRAMVSSLVNGITREDRIKRIANAIKKLAIEQVELDLWEDTDEGKSLLQSLDRAVESEKADDIEAALHSTKSHIDEFIDAIQDFDQVEHETDLDTLYEETQLKKQENAEARKMHNAPFVDLDDLAEEEDIDLTDLDYDEAPEEWLQAAGVRSRRMRTRRR
jgi:hypothetical protein